MNLILWLAVILLGTVIMDQVSIRLKLPSVVGELIGGVLLGPAFLNLIQFDGFINKIAQLGVIFLMFIAGLESNLRLLKRFFTPSVIVASIGVLFPMICFPIIGRSIGLSVAKSWFLGVTFAATSVSISVVVLEEMRRLKTKEGVTILGAAVADDIISVVLLGIVSTLTHQNVSGSKIQSLGIGWEMLCQVLYLGLIGLIVGELPRLIRNLRITALDSRSRALISLIFCLALAYLAKVVGLSSITGAFFAGLAIGQTSWKSSITRPVSSMGRLVFIPVFFVSIGLEMSITGMVNNWQLLIIMVIVAILTKLLGAGLGALSCRYSLRSALMVGSGMISRGEVALIIAQMGYAHGLLNSGLYSTIVSAVIITTILAPLIMKKFA